MCVPVTGLKIRFPILGNMQCRAKCHVDFSETEGNFALYCTISLTFPSTQIEGNTTFFLVSKSVTLSNLHLIQCKLLRVTDLLAMGSCP